MYSPLSFFLRHMWQRHYIKLFTLAPPTLMSSKSFISLNIIPLQNVERVRDNMQPCRTLLHVYYQNIFVEQTAVMRIDGDTNDIRRCLRPI